MNLQLPADLGNFVQSLVREGRFADEEAVVVEGLRLLISRERLRQEIKIGADQLNAGEGMDEDEVFNGLEEVIRAVEARRSEQS